jgi:MFS transporter, UMF1 family
MFFFITVGGVSDWGGNRKRVLTALSLAGSLVTILCIAITQAQWWSAGLMLILIGILYNASFVAYNSWLPSLAACDPSVLGAPPGPPRETVFLAAMDRLSSTGFATGYAGSVLCLLICVAITFALGDDATLAYRVNLLVSGLWWLVFSMFTFAWLRPRPGPPLPKGENYVTLPWKQLGRTLSRAEHLPRTFAYLLLYFVYSDGA